MAGYWQQNYWPSNYWDENYWLSVKGGLRGSASLISLTGRITVPDPFAPVSVIWVDVPPANPITFADDD